MPAGLVAELGADTFPELGTAATKAERSTHSASHNAYLVLVDATGAEREEIIYHLSQGGVTDADSRIIELHKARDLVSDEVVETITNAKEVNAIGICNMSSETDFNKNPLGTIYQNLAGFMQKISTAKAMVYLGSKFNSLIQNPMITSQTSPLPGTHPEHESNHTLRTVNNIFDRTWFQDIAKLVNLSDTSFFDGVKTNFDNMTQDFLDQVKHTLYRPSSGKEATQNVQDMLPFIDKVFNIQPR